MNVQWSTLISKASDLQTSFAPRTWAMRKCSRERHKEAIRASRDTRIPLGIRAADSRFHWTPILAMNSDHPARNVRARIQKDTEPRGKGKNGDAVCSRPPGTAQEDLERAQAALDENVEDRAKQGQHLRFARLCLLLEVFQSREV